LNDLNIEKEIKYIYWGRTIGKTPTKKGYLFRTRPVAAAHDKGDRGVQTVAVGSCTPHIRGRGKNPSERDEEGGSESWRRLKGEKES